MNSSEETIKALLHLSGITFSKMYRLENRYWPKCPDYLEVIAANPWWLVWTVHGPITIGMRKRVMSISWEDTLVRAIITEDDTTKEETRVHAWTYRKALEYLQELNRKLEAL